MIKFLINFYQNFISFAIRLLLGPGCRFTPTCSEYAKLSIQKYGVLTGSFYAVKRIIRCNPLSQGGSDPV